MPQSKPIPYNYAIDALRIMAILAVIAIHTTIKNLQLVSADLRNNLFTLFLNQISRFAVPLFFMISGFALELSSSIPTSYFEYLKKRLNRIFVPYVFWSAIYYFFVYQYHTTSYLYTLLAGTSSYQLYFIPALLIFYLIFPLLHKYYSIIAQKWVILIFGIIELIILYHDYYLHSINIFSPIAIALFNYFPFLLGIVAARHQEKLVGFVNRWKIPIIFTTVALAVSVFWEGESRYYLTGNYLSYYSQWRPSVLIYSIFIGSLFYYIFDRSKFQPHFIKTLSKLSFFVFFFHIIILEIICNYFNSRLLVLPLLLVVALLSFFTAYLVHKIPYLSKLTG